MASYVRAFLSALKEVMNTVFMGGLGVGAEGWPLWARLALGALPRSCTASCNRHLAHDVVVYAVLGAEVQVEAVAVDLGGRVEGVRMRVRVGVGVGAVAVDLCARVGHQVLH
eukprot:scaffold111540_cov30-Phaeocystis_antarctica.AAC.1